MKTSPNGQGTLVAFAALAALWHVLTMPGSYYQGDNFAPRTEAVFLLTTGTIGMPYVTDLKRDGFLAKRGQYFFENDRRREMFSKYGVLNTFLYLPPLWMERAVRGSPLPPLPVTQTLLAFINVFNTLFFVTALFYLYGFASLYTKKPWVRLTWVFAVCFTTYLWFYLRAPALEVYQIPAVLAAVFHSIAFWRIRRASPGHAPDHAWLNLAAASTACAVAVNLKSLFVALIPLVVVFAVCAGNGRLKPATRIGNNLRDNWKQYTLALFLPMMLGLSLLLWSNWYRFGSVMETGYGQWNATGGVAVARFGPEFVLPALKGFLFTPGNENIWMHAPLLVVALCGWGLFLRRRTTEALFVVFTTLVLFLSVCAFSVWYSGWCYGPRYLVLPVVLAIVPLVFVLDRLPAMRRSYRAALAVLAVMISIVSLTLNFAVNSLPFFASIQATGQFAAANDPGIRGYLRTHPHAGQVSLDLLLHHAKLREFPPLRVARERYEKTFPEEVEALETFIAREATPDWWVLKWLRARRVGMPGFPVLPPSDRPLQSVHQ